jgi:AraC family transcriptional regulator, regulatory protein of adaptative response / DNA-3-methyladenine glycosylase II
MDDDACYRAIETRDPRFDGRLFVAVTTTGIYCRPICPAPTPKRENVRFFPTAAAAEEAGFRPCLRCRPEISPELAFWRGSSNTVSRALQLIEAGGLDNTNVRSWRHGWELVNVSSDVCLGSILALPRSR